VIGELRSDVTKTRKDGSRGRVRYDYGDQRDPQAALAWLWKFLGGAKTAGELYGARWSWSLPSSTRRGSSFPEASGRRRRAGARTMRSATKALRKLAGPHVPASLSKLEQAVKRAHAAYEKAERAARKRRRPEADAGPRTDAGPARTSTTTWLRRRSAPARARADPPPRWHALRGRAGGGRSARAQGAGQPCQGGRRCPVATTGVPHRSRALSAPPGRPRADRTGRACAAHERRLAALGPGPRTQRLSRYSLRNQWLIALECHARGIIPTYVAGFRAFLALGRCVRKGERR
jgi:hypothetical protein